MDEDERRRIEVHDPANHLRIEAIWMVISVDENGDEGVCAAPFPTTIPGSEMTMPLIAADEARLPFIRMWAENLAKLTGKKIKLIRLDHRTEVEEF